MKPFQILFAAGLLGAALTLTGCSELFPKSGQNANMTVPTAPVGELGETISVLPEGWDETTEPEDKSSVHQLSMIVTEKTIRELDEYPNLDAVDLSGSTCYNAIVVYIQAHPEVEVTYSVDFGGASAINWAENIVLPADGVSFQSIQRNLVYLPRLQSLHLPNTSLTYLEVDALRTFYPEIAISYTAGYHGIEFQEDTAEINLAGMTAADIPAVVEMTKRLPNLNYAELMDASGTCSLTRSDVKTLVEAAPDVRFHYVFNLFGKTVSTTSDTVQFKGLSLNESSETDIREALSIMAPGSSLILDNCGLRSEFLDSIRKDYDKVDLVWRVFFGTEGRYSTLTNDDTIRAVYNVTDETCYEMRYLRSTKYMDLGHNDTLTDLSFVGFMPDIEILIVSGCMVSDLSGFENCKKLEFLELANCLKLEDISPLAGCSNLKYLNICKTKVSSLMPLDGLPIKNLFCKLTRVPVDEQKEFLQIHEGVTAVFAGKEPYAGPGWRYTDYGYTYTDFYKRVREVFDLDAVDARLRAQEKAGN